MKETSKYLLLAFVVGAFFALGMRAIELAIPKPPVQMLICLQDGDELLGHCKKIERFLGEK
jgi:hypothetical protein